MRPVIGPFNDSMIIEYKNKAVQIICKQSSLNHPFSVFSKSNTLDFSFTILLLEISLLLVLTHIMRFLLKPLRLPKVISDILAGILLGPSVLGRNKMIASKLFPNNSRFVVQNIGIMGFMFFLFVTGVKMDVGVLFKSDKKNWVIALIGIVVPHIIVWVVALTIREYMDPELHKFSTIGGVISALIITTFPVIYTVLREMQLLSSEIGRMALSTVIISDVIGINIIVAFEAVKQGEYKSINALYYVCSILALGSVIILGVPKVMEWISRQTPEGKPVDQRYIVAILLGVFIVGYMTDFIGAAIGNGPLWLGLAIPDGPPIGTTIVVKTEVLMNQVLMPFSYAAIGLLTDVYSIGACWSCLAPLFAITVMGFVSKLICVVMAARFVDMPYRDSIVLGLMLSLRGQVEFLLYLHWMDLKMIQIPSFSMMVMLTIIATSIISPLINILYDPTMPYMTNKKRTIQHTMQNTEIRIVACVYDEESLTSLFTLLDGWRSNPNANTCFTVFTLYLVELLGRACPVFIDHSQQEDEYWDSKNETLHSIVKQYQQTLPESSSNQSMIRMNMYTSVTPRRTMYQDICELALVNKVSFIILPFHKQCSAVESSASLIRAGVQSVNSNTLSHAPCSVGILASKSEVRVGQSTQGGLRRYAMLFLGGPDAREALSLADLLLSGGNEERHPDYRGDVSLLVIRFLANDPNKEESSESERKLDDGVVTWFWVKHERNDRVGYREVVVTTGLETISAMQTLTETMPIDLWIVGRRHGMNPLLLEGMTDWSENPELGVIGDYLVSPDFNTTASVLVVQQQILRDQRATPWICLD